jgi:hypothetical protein
LAPEARANGHRIRKVGSNPSRVLDMKKRCMAFVQNFKKSESKFAKKIQFKKAENVSVITPPI